MTLREELERQEHKRLNPLAAFADQSKGRPMKEEWVLNIKKQADARNIPFFFKQWGTWSKDGVKGNKKINGKVLQGRIVQNMPNFKK